MDNKEILNQLDEKIVIYKKSIKTQIANETEIIEIEELIAQYDPKDAIETRIIKNRIAEIEGLKKACIPNDTKKKNPPKNIYDGKVELIDLVDCQKWIKENKDDWQSEMNSIKSFGKKFPYENNSIKISDIKNYAIGTGRGSFCLEVEIGTPGNMGQKSSLAYYIYWSLEDDAFAMKDGVNKKVISLREAESVYVDLKKNLENMLDLANTNRIHLIEQARKNLPLPISNVLQKILFLYFPEKFMGYYSKRYVYKIAAMMRISNTLDVFQTNHEIAEKVIQNLNSPELSSSEKTVGFTVYLWRKWDNYLKESVE